MDSSTEGIPSPPPGMDFIRSSIFDESTPAVFIMSSRDVLVEGASSASAPPRGTTKGRLRPARKGAAAAAFAVPADSSCWECGKSRWKGRVSNRGGVEKESNAPIQNHRELLTADAATVKIDAGRIALTNV